MQWMKYRKIVDKSQCHGHANTNSPKRKWPNFPKFEKLPKFELLKQIAPSLERMISSASHVLDVSLLYNIFGNFLDQ